MRKKLCTALFLLLFSQYVLHAASDLTIAAVSQMTKYRVYQNDQALREFVGEAQAVAYAGKFSYSHVEKIADRTWVWDNFPRYKVYQKGLSNPKWEFASYALALSTAKKLRNVHIRDLANIGWSYHSYAKFQLFQGDNTKDAWSFASLEAAKQEAKKWGNAHIIDLASNKWIWSNLTASQIKAQRDAVAVYQLAIGGVPVQDKPIYAFLYDAITAAASIAGSEVLDSKTGKIVHSNVPAYQIAQNGKIIHAAWSLDGAVQTAKKITNAEVIYNGVVYWSGVPYLSVYQGDNPLKSFNSRESAVAYAKAYSNATIRTSDGRNIWSNAKKLAYMGWNGSASSATVLNHAANTQGLSIDSPTWFELASADGTLTDTSDLSVANALKAQGMKVMPLVHNQFNKKMTSSFLLNKAAQQKFIANLTARLVQLGASGLNLDFEEVAGSDRTAYTSFVTALSKAVHAKNMQISIDLPRGSLSWNHATAYDHAALSTVVDTIIIMAYDEHWSGSQTPGSVAGLKWAEEGIKQFLSYGIPRSKLMLGIPFYVREWKLDSQNKLVGNRAVVMKELPKLIADTNAQGIFDSESGQMKYKYAKDGFTYLFWAETETTVKARIDMAKRYDLAGVAAWRLGYESTELWTMMLRNK
ncbi:spore germination protein YaaH [Paenibacillus endophyticus]|uniref:Spore germination protein YaaH n=1 Tax=Paenibacillus endophyticus TaxID=1294268 RepID=A0A7W5C5X5_9BACL|nr:glycosyl hydrolase family 18 protein [Paenibacillus endophyticus]MBB3151730.1 spore germination protein YaaH [Paenibacillus endophyticus]